MDIKSLLKLTAEKEASDLILVTGSPPILRLAGKLTPTDSPPLDKDVLDKIIDSMLTAQQKEKFEQTKELDFSYQLPYLPRFRVNLHFEKGNPAASLRLIPLRIPSLEELRLPKAVADLSEESRGLILVTGPTGSGKTTTQACLVDMINSKKSHHIITIEDPIEYLHTNKKSVIEQREVGIDTLSFISALRHVLRQNPDVILIGEMRDLETIQTALTAAETGHLVISTLHTGNSIEAIDRIIDVFPPQQQNQIRAQLSLTLKGIIAQQLIERKDKEGLIAAVEIMLANAGIKNLIRKSQTHEIYSLIEISGKIGMQSMDLSLRKLYLEKLITYEEALSRAMDAEALAKSLV